MMIFKVRAYLPKIEDCEKNKHRHMFDIGVSLSSLASEHYILSMTKSFRNKTIYEQELSIDCHIENRV